MTTGRPLNSGHQANGVSRNAGSFRGSLSGWRPNVAATVGQEVSERKLTQSRAADLAANDWAANSGLNAITTNAIGTGLKPRARLPYRRLGISREAAREVGAEMGDIWSQWTSRAHLRGQLHFEDLQFLGLRTMLQFGELFFVPVRRKISGSPVELAIQDISPSRLLTPMDKIGDPSIVDGVELNNVGAPVAYWVATPTATSAYSYFDPAALVSSQFTRVPAQVGHRPGAFHLFRHLRSEQVRGESIFSPGINLFRHLSDSLDHELLAQVITSSFAYFIAREQGGSLPDYVRENVEQGEPTYYQDVVPGTVLYGNDGEKPHLLESARPSPNWNSFCEFTLRSMAASIDMPYEILAKDFSKTNYSSARAALLEAWRVFMLYRVWLVRHFCQPLWAMVMEEAFLRGRLKLPSGAVDWYDTPDAWAKTMWIGPARGYVDPVKETAATVTALEHNLMTHSEALAERGRGFGETMDEIEEEQERLTALKGKDDNFQAVK